MKNYSLSLKQIMIIKNWINEGFSYDDCLGHYNSKQAASRSISLLCRQGIAKRIGHGDYALTAAGKKLCRAIFE